MLQHVLVQLLQHVLVQVRRLLQHVLVHQMVVVLSLGESLE
jgi:hypothetical protein